MRRHTTLAFALTLLLAGPASASDWQIAALLDKDSGHVEIDVSSISTKGKLRKAWFKWTHSTPQKIPPSSRTDAYIQNYTTSKDLNYFNCSERTSSAIQTIYYDNKGTVVGSSSINASLAQYDEVAPDTVGETMLETVCKAALPPS